MVDRIKKACVVGAGSAGFLSAVALKRLLPKLDVTVVYSSKLPVVGVGESTTDIFPRFLHQQLQLDRQRFFDEVRPSWKLGVRFEWGAKDVPHFNYGFDQVFSARIPSLRKTGAFYCLDDPTDSGYFWALMDRSKSPLIRFPSGRYENYWVKNVIAIGNASGFVEPLEATALHLIAVQLSAACAALLDSNYRIVPSVQRVLNRQFRTMWDDVRDFLAVHYRFNEKLDTPFWRRSREETSLGGAQGLIDFYREAGPHRLGEAELPRESIFRYEGYLTMLIGQRVPTQFRGELTDQDRQDWAAHRNRMASVASHALPVREGLNVVRDPRFSWPKT